MVPPLCLLLLGLFVAPSGAAELAPILALPPNASLLTYGELADVVVPPLWVAMVELLPSLTPGVTPADVKPVRKAILALRNGIDIFSYAYPLSNPNYESDPLPYIRDLLDEGYETIGHFRDLQESGVNYTKKELVTRRCEVLSWEADFEEKMEEHQIEAYLDSPMPTKLEMQRKASHLSSFFWGNTGFVPSEGDTGLHTVVKLQKALLDIAEQKYSPLVQLTDMTDEKQAAEMHDYRKQLRGILWIAASLPVWNASQASNVEVLQEAYDGLGKVEDAINAYVFEVLHGDSKSIAAAKADLEEEWEDLVKWLDDDNLEPALAALIENLIHY